MINFYCTYPIEKHYLYLYKDNGNDYIDAFLEFIDKYYDGELLKGIKIKKGGREHDTVALLVARIKRLYGLLLNDVTYGGKVVDLTKKDIFNTNKLYFVKRGNDLISVNVLPKGTKEVYVRIKDALTRFKNAMIAQAVQDALKGEEVVDEEFIHSLCDIQDLMNQAVSVTKLALNYTFHFTSSTLLKILVYFLPVDKVNYVLELAEKGEFEGYVTYAANRLFPAQIYLKCSDPNVVSFLLDILEQMFTKYVGEDAYEVLTYVTVDKEKAKEIGRRRKERAKDNKYETLQEQAYKKEELVRELECYLKR